VVANIHEIIKAIEQKNFRSDLPEFNVGDTVKMKIKVQEADKVRLHPFEGTIIRKTGKGVKGTFTVRKISFGEGVERIFPIHSPVIESLKVVSRGKTNRAKLYYLRDRQGKSAKIERQIEPATQAAPAQVAETSAS
jgi:large subunit ribosomal protein L19